MLAPTFSFVTIAAIIDSINPCAFSVLLLTIAFLFSRDKNRREILTIGGVYIFGIFVTYIFIGFAGLSLLQKLQLGGPRIISKIGALILIIGGALNLINEYCPSFPIKLKIPKAGHNKIAEWMAKATAPAAFVLGILVGVYEFPCTGMTYVATLALLHGKETLLRGIFYLLYYNLLFVLPLIIILTIASHKTLLAKVQAWRKKETGAMRYWDGVAMIALGLIIVWFL